MAPMYLQHSYSSASARSPLLRSSSRQALIRSNSYASGLSRSPSATIFGRALQSSALFYTPPLHSVAVQRSTPHYSDRYPHVRYSYGDAGGALIDQTNLLGRNHYSQRSRSTRQYLEGKWSMYDSSLRFGAHYGRAAERPVKPYRPYVRYMNVEDAVDMYKKRCMTVGALSKYWLTPRTWQSRQEKEWSLGRSACSGDYSYATRYSSRPRYY